MSTSRSTFGAILGTITVASNVISNTLGVIDTTIGMGNIHVNDASRRLTARSTLDAASFKLTIAREKAMEMLIEEQSVIDWCSESPDRAERFAVQYNQFLAVLG